MIAELGAAIAGLKVGIDLLRGVTAADKALGEADLKMKLNDAASRMIDAQQALMDARLSLEEQAKEIARLDDALAIRSTVVRAGSAYYDADVNSGQPVGEGYCMRCYERDHRLYHLAYGQELMNSPVLCPVCKTQYVYAGVYPRELRR